MSRIEMVGWKKEAAQGQTGANAGGRLLDSEVSKVTVKRHEVKGRPAVYKTLAC